MRLKINNEMKKLLGNINFLKFDDINLSLEKYYVFPKFNKNEIEAGPYFYSKWIDKMTFNKEMNLYSFLNISYIIGIKWLFDINKMEHKRNFILIIQYSGEILGLDDKNQGFQLRLYTEEGFKTHFGKEGINSYEVPYISIEL